MVSGASSPVVDARMYQRVLELTITSPSRTGRERKRNKRNNKWETLPSTQPLRVVKLQEVGFQRACVGAASPTWLMANLQSAPSRVGYSENGLLQIMHSKCIKEYRNARRVLRIKYFERERVKERERGREIEREGKERWNSSGYACLCKQMVSVALLT